MNLFFNPRSKRFSKEQNGSILSQILREPIPDSPITLDFTYLSCKQNIESIDVLENQCVTTTSQVNFIHDSYFKLPILTSADFLNKFQSSKSETHVLVESDSANILHQMQPQQLEETQEITNESNATCVDYSTEALLNAIFYLNKNMNLQPASEFDNWSIPIYSDMPMYDD